jgi:hypothetical protein
VLRTWQEQVLPWSPDVVVLAYGEAECARPRLPHRAFARRARRVDAELEVLIGHIRTVASPLVLVPGIAPPTTAERTSLPRRAARYRVMDDQLRGLVARLDEPDIRFVPSGPSQAEDLAGSIVAWAAAQPHLDLSEARARRSGAR